MKILIIGDSHGNITNLKVVMDIAKKTGIDSVIHCGDWDDVKSIETALSYKLPVFTILGNADVSDDLIQKLKLKSQKYNSKFIIFELGGRIIGVTHKPSDNKKYFEGKNLDIIFNGHYHSKDESMWKGIKVVRAGALKDGINFAVYNTASNRVEFISDGET